MRIASTFALAAIALFLSESAMPASSPPAAARKPKVLEKFGDRRVDDYFWLREKSNPEVIDYLKAENAYTDEFMKPLEGFREKLYKEMLARIKETDESVAYRKRGYWYYTREVEGRQYPIYCRRKGTMEAPEEVILDVNQLAEGRKFTQVSSLEVSPDGNMLAYTVDFTGFRQYTARFKDLATGKLLDDKLERVDSMAWSADGRHLFYVVEDDAKRPYRLLRHALGSATDALVFEEKDELYNLGVADTRDQAWIVATSASKDASEVRVLASKDPTGRFRLVEKRRDGHEYYLDAHGGEFYLRTNDKGRNFRVVSAPAADPGQKNWKEVLPHRKLVMLDDIDVFKDFWVVSERDKGQQRLRIFDFATGTDHYIAFDEAVYSAHATSNAEYDTPKLRFSYQSFITPRSTFDYEVAGRSRALLKQQPVLGGYQPGEYQSEAHFATAKDGTRVPISLVYKKSLRKAGPQPLLLYGYGSYGIPMDVNFRSSRLSLLDRGVVFAIAHIRGGGDLGKLWYDDGKLMKKSNTFTDFVASAEYLVEKGYTAPDRLAIQGGSAGGLLMGAVVNMRPDLFKVVVSQVPFVDVVSTMLDASLPLTVGEYLEWGNPNVKKYYDYMRAYSPYDNLAKRAYPAMLVETSLNDSQVMYWEPAKYVARLRTLKTDGNPLLLKTVMEAGHGGASGRYDALQELSLTYTFVLDQLGLAK
jgi:oligopeptidase B